MRKLSSMAMLLVISGMVPAGLSQELNLALAAKLDATVPVFLEKFKEPGVAVAFMDGCGPATIRAYGLADRERAIPVRENTVFGLQSISKTFTAWAVVTLANEGRIKLDDPIDTYLKRWRVPDSAFDRKGVTIRRLLSHTAGLSHPEVSSVGASDALPSLIDELNGKGSSKTPVSPTKAPGEVYEYSGGGYAVLQLLIEDVTGRPFAEYVQESVFRKLGMASTGFGLGTRNSTQLATPYLATGEVHPREQFSAAGAAGMHSTATDMGAFLKAHCEAPESRPSARVLPLETLTGMMAAVPVRSPGERPSVRFGLGYMVYPARDFALVGHSGSGGGWSAQFMLVPSLGIGIAVLTNSEGGQTRNEILKMFRDAVLSRTQLRPGPQTTGPPSTPSPSRLP